MRYNNLNDLFRRIESDIQDTLSEDVADCVKDEMEFEIQMNVYNAYSPLYYKRREYNFGLIDQSNMESKVEGNTLTVKDIAPLNKSDNSKSNWELDEIVVNGYGNMPFSRDFYAGTKERLEEHGYHTEALRDGLKKRGYNVK